MKTFVFSVVASGLDPAAPDFERRFLSAGCDDATISFQGGRVIIDFERQAPSLKEALSSATAAVRSAGARVESVGVG